MAMTARETHARQLIPGSIPPPTPVEPVIASATSGGRDRLLRRLRRTRASLIAGLVVLGLVALLAIVGPWITPYNPLKPDTNAITVAPSGAHWVGTDQYGRDVLARVVAAARLDLAVAIS